MTRQERRDSASRSAVNTATLGRVLVVDDEEDRAELLVVALAGQGFHVRIASPFSRALAVAAEFDPHVVLLDLHRGELDGYEIGRQIRQQGRRDVQIVALTGDARRIAPERSNGFAAHLLKPIAIHELAGIVSVLQSRAHLCTLGPV